MGKQITQTFWDAIAVAGCATAFSVSSDGTQFVYNPSLTAAEITAIEAVFAAYDSSQPSWTLYKQQADALLAESDTTVLRCIENQVALPAGWVSYRQALRAIVGAAVPGDATEPLPIRPEFPAGT